MKEKKYLIWIDILGFEALAAEIGDKKGIKARKIRDDFTDVIDEKVNEAIKKKILIGKNYGKRDDWILVAEGLEEAFFAISEVLDHTTDYEDYPTIPLEIAIGCEEYDKWAKFDGKGLICEDKTIDWLKTYIVSRYSKWYEKAYGHSIKETFIVISDSVYMELKGHHKKECTKHGYKDKEFYSLPLSVIEREGKLSDFLKEIGQSRSDYSGALIDRIFVPPDEFEEIKSKLNKNRLVFITGTAGYGKTYTAIRLLWEKYNEEYIPRWVAGKEPEDRKTVRDILANIEPELKPKHIIYFEDPFGKTIYERRDDLKGRINSIINSVRNKEDVNVIITSRKDVFEKFEKESYSVEEIEKFEEELNILKPSYGYEKRKKILEKWAGEKECVWLKDESLKKIVFESLKNEKRLPTPLSIYDFVMATVKVDDKKELREKTDKYSEAVDKAFADEIKGLYDSGRKDRVLFLSFIFVSQYLKVGFVKKVYENLKKEGFEDFEGILKEEYRVKVGKSWDRKRILEFSHPSYSNARSYILDHPGCKNIFCEVLKELSQYDVAELGVAEAVADNFSKLPEGVRNKLMRKLCSKINFGGVSFGTAHAIARAVAKHFDKLPEDVRNWLFKLFKMAYGRLIAGPIIDNFDKLPEDVRNLLFKLSKKDITATVWPIVMNLDKLPVNVRNKLLLKLFKKGGFARFVAQVIEKGILKAS